MKLTKNILVGTFIVAAATYSQPSFALDPEIELEIRRFEQQVAKITEINEQLFQDVRMLQRNLEEARKEIKILTKKYTDTIDELVKVKNVHIANLRAGQKSLYEQLDVLDWGNNEESCDKLGVKHQQVAIIKSADNTKYLRFLCFDGKPLHLSTEVSTPLEE